MNRHWLKLSLAASAVAAVALVATQPPLRPAQAPTQVLAQTPAEKIQAAMGRGRYDEQADVRGRLAKLEKWQQAQRSGDPTQAFTEPAGALAFFLAKRLSDGQTALPSAAYQEAIAKAEQMPVFSTAQDRFMAPGEPAPSAPQEASTPDPQITAAVLGTWTPLGPGNIGGRTRALLIHPTTPTTMWAGGVAGGIWKTTNGGGSWTPKADFLVNIAVNSMILDPRNPDHLFAGTGEGYFNGDAVRGAGILESTDGGETWTRLASTDNPDFHYVQKIAMSKGSSQRLYAATRTGIWRSTNGGASWVKTLDAVALNGCMDLTMQTDRALALVFAACGTFVQSSVFRALDTGSTQTWTSVLSPPGAARTSLAIAPSNQNVLYALASSNVGGPGGNYLDGLLGVWRSTNSGATWTQRVSNMDPIKQNTLLLSNPVIAALTECGFGVGFFLNQGWYDNFIAVDPKDPNIVWAGGIDVFRSDDGGQNWGQASHWWFTRGVDPEYNHADHHSVVFHPQYDGTSNRIMFSTNDGGIYRTDDARAPVAFSNPITPATPMCGTFAPGTLLSWVGLNNGYETTQFYHGLPYPDGNTFFGGTQDNGTIRGTVGGGPGAWSEIFGGDGGYVAVNPNNTNMLWEETTGLSIRRSTDGGVNWSFFTSGITEPGGNFLFITPFNQDPNDANRMWIGGARLWRTTQATSDPAPATIWTLSSQFLASRVSAHAVAPGNSDRVYAGTQAITGNAAVSGVVWTTGAGTTANAGTVWTGAKPRPGINYVSWIDVHPTLPGTVYATISTFNNAAGTGHVFKSTDFGATWTNIDGSGATGIPDVPAHCILIDPDNPSRLYVGTDIGVFVSVDDGANWARENTGFANVITESMSINRTGATKYIYAFTHGRSLFRVLKP